MPSFDLIVTAAGSSMRFNSDSNIQTKKECVLIGNKSVLRLALEPFLKLDGLSKVVITYPEGHRDDITNALGDIVLPQRVTLSLVQGGKTRTESVRNACLFLLEKKTESSLIAIHDGARPYIKTELIERILNNAEKFGSSAPALRLTDAIKSTDGDEVISSLDRSRLVRLQTPQIFERRKLLDIYSSMADDESYQDDTEPYLLHGGKCFIIEGDEENIKITYRNDLGRKRMRVGFGNDIHRLEEGRNLILGGVILPHTKGEVAHSDGDALIHAVIDAILGASALGDIGHFFPPEDEKWKDSDSRDLLRIILGKVQPEIINVDATVTLEGFKLAPYILPIRESLSSLLGVEISRVSVKAKTNEGLDSLGEGKAVKAEVVILLN